MNLLAMLLPLCIGGPSDCETYAFGQQLHSEPVAGYEIYIGDLKDEIKKQVEVRAKSIDQRDHLGKLLLDKEMVVALNSLSTLTGSSPLPNVRIRLDMRDLKLSDALRSLAMLAKIELAIDEDAPLDSRVTAVVPNVCLVTALDLLSQSGGAAWRVETKGSATRVRVGRSLKPSILSWQSGSTRPAFATFDQLRAPTSARTLAAPVAFSMMRMEDRSTFTCPHCDRKATVVKESSSAHCPKCTKRMKDDWQFCPSDGARRPAAVLPWKFCPMCGKSVASMTAKSR